MIFRIGVVFVGIYGMKVVGFYDSLDVIGFIRDEKRLRLLMMSHGEKVCKYHGFFK